jgi:FkbH-like protein
MVDDSPAELEEVRLAFPELATEAYPAREDEVPALLSRLRDRVGTDAVREEDRLRLSSLRAAAVVRAETADSVEAAETFLREAQAEMSVADVRADPDPRALELVNKTNQFNLNGRRFTEAEWRREIDGPGRFLWLVSYRDRYGPLGKIAVLSGGGEGHAVRVSTWVMSCRAFPRRIEYRCLELLFDRLGVDEVRLDFVPTERNEAFRDFLDHLGLSTQPGEQVLSRARFAPRVPALYHRVEERNLGD